MLDGGFVALAFSFCAAMDIIGGQDVVALGYISRDKCIVHARFGDSHGDTVTINHHSIGIDMIKDGAVVHIDELLFVIQKTDGV